MSTVTMKVHAHAFHPLGFLRRRTVTGFTLIDLLIACIILAILAAIAYPTYAGHLRKAHRTDAKTILLETAQYMERYYSTHNTYAGASVDAISAVCPKGADASRARYHLSFANTPTASAFTLQAVPVNGQEADPCGILTVNQLGAHTPGMAGCW